MAELKPCPFCGHSAPKLLKDRWPVDDQGHFAKAFWVRCGKCGSTSDEFKTSGEAEKAWNRRAVPALRGQWVGEGDGYANGEIVLDVWHCDNCNYCIDDGTDDPDDLPNYCPNCGAKMKGENEE